MDNDEKISNAINIVSKTSYDPMISDDNKSVAELDKEWNDFMSSMSQKNRRHTDDLSTMITGKTNLDRYEDQLQELTESVDIYNSELISRAKEWSEKSNIALVYPSDDIDILYQNFLNQSQDLKYKANWELMELFGIDNEQMYRIVKSDADIDVNLLKDMNDYDLANTYISTDHDLSNDNGNFVDKVKKKTLKKNIERELNKRIVKRKYKVNKTKTPMLSPVEIKQLEGFYSDNSDDKYKTILEEYTNWFYGYENNFNVEEWDKAVRECELKLEYNIDDINETKQNLITLGWNPEIPYTPENINKSKIRIESLIQNICKNTIIYDASSLCDSFNYDDEVLQESNSTKTKYPIHLILVRGSRGFSGVISKITNSEFSHSAICLDNDFKRLYSFNLKHESHEKGGLSLENIKYYPQNNRLAVFTIFVTADQYITINNNIQNLLYDMPNTHYSISSIIAMPFKNIDTDSDENLICSQFVDKMLKLANIDITNIKSSKVVPGDIYNIALKNAKIYKIFDGITKDFNPDKAARYVDKLSKTAKFINESSLPNDSKFIYENIIKEYTIASVCEAKKLPIRFNDDGDLLLSKPDSFKDFDQVFFDTHKLLLQYDKANNIEGMKYEIARLYYINYLLEKRIYSNKYKSSRENNIKTRARVLNDFNKYMKVILKSDKNFNFSEYYEDTPFYPYTVEVDKKTISSLKDLIHIIF